jgi:predicted O-methyltransferase YrrM/prolipoprotein diacylglyceryltransferase
MASVGPLSLLPMTFDPSLKPAWILVPALVCSAFVLRADFKRRTWPFNPYRIVAIAILAGVAGKALFLLLTASRGFLGEPLVTVLTPAGAMPETAPAWYAGFLCCVAALAALAWRAKIPALEFLDSCAPAAAAGAALVFLGYLLAGFASRVTGVRPLATAEFLASAAIAAFLWWMGVRAVRGPKAKGEIFCNYLVLTGLARFVFHFIAARQRNSFGLSGVQAANAIMFFAGVALLWRVKARFHALKQEHRILDHIAARGDILQSEYHRPTPECPHPERWHMYDSMSAEAEVLDFLKSVVTTIKPELVVETGTFTGLSTLRIAEGLRENGFGRVVTCEYDAKVFAAAQKRFAGSDLGAWIDARNASSLELEVPGRIDLLFCDSDGAIREREVRRFLPQMNPHGLIVMHDASSTMKVVRQAALRLEAEGLLSVLLLPTPRGLVLAQKREGRA